jgi:hypothetical protein
MCYVFVGSILIEAKLVIPRKGVNTMFIVCVVAKLSVLTSYYFITN